MQEALLWQASAVVSLAQGSAVTQTPAGQAAPAGQASTGTQVHRLFVSPGQSEAFVKAEQLSLTVTAGSVDGAPC